MGHWLIPALAALIAGFLLGLAWRGWTGRADVAAPDDSAGGESDQSQSMDAILRALARAARMVFGARGNDEIMPEALATLGRSVGADRVYVFENHHDPESGALLGSMRYEWCSEGIRAEIDNPDMQGMGYDEALPNWRATFEAGQPVSGLVEHMQRQERELLTAQNILSILVVPIFLDGVFWGLIGFDDCSRRREWGQAEVDALQIAAGTIGGAIRSVRAEEKLRRLVSTDSLTGLSSRRAFMQRARSLIEAGDLQYRPISLLLMDLDHFKRINDSFGHPAGDQALVRFSAICRDVLRDDDLIGRTGGEEFAVVLAGAGGDDALEVAEKLRSRVEADRVETESGVIDLSVSIGLATLSEDECDLNALLKRGDDALYAAKRGGRNRVERAPVAT